MASLLAANYLVRQPIERAILAARSTLPQNATVYDIGAGHQPYAAWFQKYVYMGVDTDSESPAKIKYAEGTLIPLPTGSADLILCTQTLQHSQDPRWLMAEIHRLLKSGGTAIITVAYGTKMAAQPYRKQGMLWRDDYWRFTKFGVLSLCEEFEVVALREATGYAGALLQLKNYFIASLNIGILGVPLYVVNNIVALLVDAVVKNLCPFMPRGRYFYDAIYLSFTSNYTAIIKKP